MILGNILGGAKQLTSMGALPYFGVIAAVAFIAGMGTGGWGAYKLTRAHFERATLRAQLDLSNFTGTLASNAADGQKLARETAEKAHADVDAWRQGIEARIDSGFAAVGLQFARDITKLRNSINEPRFDCLRTEPLPGAYLQLLTRPGGSVAAGAREDPGTAEAAGSLF